MLDLARQTATRVTLEQVDRVSAITPIWSRDGSHLWLGGVPGLFRTDPDGRAPREIGAEGMVWVTDISPDGQTLIYQRSAPQTSLDIWALPLAGNAQAGPYLNSRAAENFGRLSPDGRWLAYGSDETGEFQVYVDSFPSKSRRTLVSTRGGLWPMWRADGRELYYLTANDRMMVVDVSASPEGPRFSSPRELLTSPRPNGYAERPQYVPSADGQRFLFNAQLEDSVPRTIEVILNWPALVTAR